MGERPADGFRLPLTPEQQDWLFGDQPKGTGLAEEWRRRLREDYDEVLEALRSGTHR